MEIRLLLVEMMLKLTMFLKMENEGMKREEKERRNVRGKKDDNKGNLMDF